MKRTTTTELVKCDCCGVYEPECDSCKKFFKGEESIICYGQ